VFPGDTPTFFAELAEVADAGALTPAGCPTI